MEPKRKSPVPSLFIGVVHNPGEIDHKFRRMSTTKSGMKRPLFQEIPESRDGVIGICSRQPILIPLTHLCRFRQKITPF